MTGFLEESPGVKSSTRLTGLILALACLGLATVSGVCALMNYAAVVTALSTPIGALAAGCWGALRERTTT